MSALTCTVDIISRHLALTGRTVWQNTTFNVGDSRGWSFQIRSGGLLLGYRLLKFGFVVFMRRPRYVNDRDCRQSHIATCLETDRASAVQTCSNSRSHLCTVLCLSVVWNVCIVAKRCVLPKNCLKMPIGNGLWGIEWSRNRWGWRNE